jgi:hypothetical protein
MESTGRHTATGVARTTHAADIELGVGSRPLRPVRLIKLGSLGPQR